MSSLLCCFPKERRNSDTKKKKKKHSRSCKCSCNISTGESDSTDGKSFSKTLHIADGSSSSTTRKCCKRGPTSCYCESSASTPDSTAPVFTTALPSPSSVASVDPSGSPFFLLPHQDENLPGKSYMPVAKDSPNYNMNHPRRGKAVIFNFDRWDNTNIPHLALSPRLGSEKDKKDLARTLRRLDFQVEDQLDNLTHLKFWAVLERLRREDHTDADCLVVVLMTHGEKNTVYMRCGTQFPINLIWENFEAHRCPSLAGKPKIFIVQACRGKQYDSGTKLLSQGVGGESSVVSLSDVTDSSNFSYVIPNAADILVAFSCPLGHYSWRHPERGSWFVQAVCKVFNEHAYKMDLQELFTTVAREVALNYQSNTTNIESNNKKQVTSTSSTLIRNVYFKPKFSSHSNGGSARPFPLEQEVAGSEDGNLELTSLVTNVASPSGQRRGSQEEEREERISEIQGRAEIPENFANNQAVSV